MVTGSFTEEFCASRDEYRMQKADIKSSATRQKKHAIREGHLDKNHEKEGDTYVSVCVCVCGGGGWLMGKQGFYIGFVFDGDLS